MELQEERVQRLQDLQEIYAKDKQLELLASEMVSPHGARNGCRFLKNGLLNPTPLSLSLYASCEYFSRL